MAAQDIKPNLFDRLAQWFGRTTKATPPTPADLYRSSPVMSYPRTFPGWDALEQGSRDEQRVKLALTSPWVWSDVHAIANEFASASLIVKERTADGLKDIDNHPLEVLWEQPNPYMGRSYVMRYWAISYVLTGKAFLFWAPRGEHIAEIWPVPPFMLSPIADASAYLRGYAFRAAPDATPQVIDARYITFSRNVNLFDTRDGMSFLVAAMLGIESDQAAALWNRNFFREQNGIPDGLITVKPETLDVDLARIRLELRDFFGGMRRGVAVARAGEMDYKPFGRSQKDAEWMQGRAFDGKLIDRTLGFPEGYWSERANRANAEQARATMIANTVWPLLVTLQEDINAQQTATWYGAQYRVEFEDIRPEDRELKLREMEMKAKLLTLDELRAEIGYDPLGDRRGSLLVAEIGRGPTPVDEETPETMSAAHTQLPPAEIPEDADLDTDIERWTDAEAGAVKHLPGAHDQRSHGRATARRSAVRAAYSAARARGASIEEARAAARDVSQVYAARQRLANIEQQLSGAVTDATMRSLAAERRRLEADIAAREARTPEARNVPRQTPTVRGRQEDDPLWGSSYRQRQEMLARQFEERERQRRAKEQRDEEAARQAFFAQQLGMDRPSSPPPTQVRDLPKPDKESSPGASFPADIERATSRVRLGGNWDAPSTERQQNYLRDLVARARTATAEGSPQRQLADELLDRRKSLTKWEASQLIDAMQQPQPLTALVNSAYSAARARRDHYAQENPGRRTPHRSEALFALPNFQFSLRARMRTDDALAEGLPF